jgi:hypothetical protein
VLVVVSLSYLDFGQFRKTLYIRMIAIEKLTRSSTGQSINHLKQRETALDSDPRMKMAKVQSYKTGHKRQKLHSLTSRITIRKPPDPQ